MSSRTLEFEVNTKKIQSVYENEEAAEGELQRLIDRGFAVILTVDEAKEKFERGTDWGRPSGRLPVRPDRLVLFNAMLFGFKGAPLARMLYLAKVFGINLAYEKGERHQGGLDRGHNRDRSRRQTDCDQRPAETGGRGADEDAGLVRDGQRQRLQSCNGQTQLDRRDAAAHTMGGVYMFHAALADVEKEAKKGKELDGLRMVCFVHFDLEMCFVPQRVQFTISHLARWLRARRLASPH